MEKYRVESIVCEKCGAKIKFKQPITYTGEDEIICICGTKYLPCYGEEILYPSVYDEQLKAYKKFEGIVLC